MAFADDLRTKAERIEELALEKLIEENETNATVPEWVSEKEGALSYITGRFMWFAERDPADFDSVLDELVGARDLLTSEVPGGMDAVNTQVSSWYGTAADNFEENYLNGFQPRLANQVGVVEELIAAASILRDMVERSHENILGVADGTIAKLEEYDPDAGNGVNWSMTLTVVGALLSVAAAPFSGGTSLALAFAGGVAGVASQSVPEEAQVAGSSVAEILGSMHGAIQNVQEAMAAVEEDVATELEEDVEMVSAQVAAAYDKGSSQLVSPRPVLADQQSGTYPDFRPEP
ncbi:hypothetical protein FB566_0219 [Stackebrandtia endophytica]|uniref:Uncharacterized protein n=1 Tax=Stackebrandtia endophytica TaxID=1496996 RepID=A0A543AQ62_9ACTN|nr:hypothetical protein [Stackebrandtia endophytica]TQL74733.1 hypothetical protein FB566_0219 [Stackebrandtia endophytica]